MCVIFADKEDKVSNGAFRFVYTNRGPFTCVTVCMCHFLWQGKQSVRWGILIYWYRQKALHLCNCLYALPSDTTDKMSGEAFWFIDTNRGPFTHVTVCMCHFLWQGKQSVRWGIPIYWYQQKAPSVSFNLKCFTCRTVHNLIWSEVILSASQNQVFGNTTSSFPSSIYSWSTSTH